MMNQKLRRGDLVRVHVANHDRFGSRDIRNINGQVFTISKVHAPYVYSSSRAKATESYYELEGVESSHGIPYSFIKDWLIPVGEYYEV